MNSVFFLLVFFSFTYCLAQINSMEYFNKGRCEESIPDFAALAVLEKQHCPRPFNHKDPPFNRKDPQKEQICASRYRILSVLYAASDTLKKEYVETKEKPVSPYFQHRPMLIFGKHKNGFLQIEGYEETWNYFVFGMDQNTEFLSIAEESSEIYTFRSIGSPYGNASNLDSIDIAFYNEYLMPRFKYHVEGAGKNFGELLLRLLHNRTPVKAAKIKNNFAALAVIENLYPASNFKQANTYGLSVEIENIFKNDAKIGPNIAIFIDGERLPPSWGCSNSSSRSKRQPFYLLGDLRDGNLVVESLVSTRDAFVFGDTIYDMSMGFPFEELITYFLPSNISLEEFKFGRCWGYAGDVTEIFTRKGSSLASLPDSLREAIMEIAVKQRDFLDSKHKLIPEMGAKFKWTYLDMFPSLYDVFRCRPDGHHATIMIPCACREPLFSRNYGVWGKK
ncbi:MAG: hypothetical protein LBQ87_08505 [Candidatus Fibromonas sp.]|nr:hypothetical protein [Candidatus Fibromonas sp.]